MAFKLKTSKKTEEILSRIESSEKIPWPALVKLAIALSIKGPPLEEEDFNTNSLGRELNRQTITADTDVLFKCLVEQHAGKHLSDDEFFPAYVKAHLDRGAVLLEQEQKYASDFLIHLSELDRGI